MFAVENMFCGSISMSVRGIRLTKTRLPSTFISIERPPIPVPSSVAVVTARASSRSLIDDRCPLTAV
jgi:hypothetical protein